jgi:UDP-GlcNAc:undecaprenyl-phosphate GlcNAc-1-phosphate transferase
VKLRFDGFPLVTRASVPVLIIAVPLFDTALVVWSRWRAGRPVFRGGTDHSSHRLVKLGATPVQAALFTYMTGTLTGSAALILLRLHNPTATWVVVGTAFAAGIVLLLGFDRVPLVEGQSEEISLTPPSSSPALAPAWVPSHSQVPLTQQATAE